MIGYGKDNLGAQGLKEPSLSRREINSLIAWMFRYGGFEEILGSGPLPSSAQWRGIRV
jgi:hypothetical protein